MMKKNALWMVGFLFFTSTIAHCNTIVLRETDKLLHKDGVMEKSEGQYEYTFFWEPEKAALTRTRIFDYQSNKITPDETVHQIDPNAYSYPLNAVRYNLSPVIRATGRSGPDTIEMVVIGEKYAEVCTATADQLVVSHAKRLS